MCEILEISGVSFEKSSACTISIKEKGNREIYIKQKIVKIIF
jgi:hypothetical protein